MHAQQWPQGHVYHRPTRTLTPSVVKHTLTSRLLNCKKMGISALIKYGTCIFQERISCNHHNFSSPDINSSLKWRMDPVHVLGRVFLFLSPLPTFHDGPPRTTELMPHTGLLSGRLLKLNLFPFFSLFTNSLMLTMATLFLLFYYLFLIVFVSFFSLH